MQQVEFGRPHFNRLVAEEDATALAIQNQLGNLYTVLFIPASGASQQRLDAGDQLARGKRFGDIVVSTHIQPLDHIVLRGLRCEHDDGHVTGGVGALEPAQQLQATAAGQHPVQQNHVRAFVNDQSKGILDVLRLKATEARNLQRHAQHIADGKLIINNQYLTFIHWSHCPLFRAVSAY